MSTRTLRRVATVVASAAVVAALGVPARAATGATAPTVTPEASVAAATSATSVIPADCGTLFHRTADGTLYYGTVIGGKGGAGTIGTFTFGGTAETPVTMAYVRALSTTPAVEQYIATRSDGTLWEIRAALDSDTITTRQIGTGWSGIRELVTGDSGYIYGLTTTGGLARYTLSTGGSIRGAGSVATAGWSGVRSLTWGGGGTYNGAKVDGLLALNSNGGLMEYLVRLDTRAPRGFTLKASGWSGFKRISVGSCSKSSGRPIAGVTAAGELFAYLDTNGFNLSGSDIRSAGQVGRGFTGLVFD